MAAQLTGFSILFVLSIATALIVYVLVRHSLSDLLDETIKLPPATAFYTRLLLVGLMLVALGYGVGTSFKMGEDPVFMEYVWRAADGLSSVFLNIIWYVVAYLVIVTILLLVLRRQHVK
jgi:preprotein translocase subunit SecG